jgi:hypothetical protein
MLKVPNTVRDEHIPMETPAINPFSVLHQKENPVISRQTAIQGNVKSKRFLGKEVRHDQHFVEFGDTHTSVRMCQ